MNEIKKSEAPAVLVENLRRTDDGTVYARRCLECGGTWKIYQKSWHTAGCRRSKGKILNDTV